MKTLLQKFRELFVLVKFRLDLTMQFIQIINFILLVILVSDKINYYISIKSFLFLLPIILLLISLLFGWILDSLEYQNEYYRLQTKRNPIFSEWDRKLRNIEEKINERT